LKLSDLQTGKRVPEGLDDDVVRAVTENSNTLKFENHGFEEE